MVTGEDELIRSESGNYSIRLPSSQEDPSNPWIFELEQAISDLAKEFSQNSCHYVIFAVTDGAQNSTEAAVETSLTPKNFMVLPMQATFA